MAGNSDVRVSSRQEHGRLSSTRDGRLLGAEHCWVGLELSEFLEALSVILKSRARVNTAAPNAASRSNCGAYQ